MTIKRFREIHGLSQAAMAERVILPNGKHLYQPAISIYERGLRSPSSLHWGVAEALSEASRRIARSGLGREPEPGEYIQVKDLVHLDLLARRET